MHRREFNIKIEFNINLARDDSNQNMNVPFKMAHDDDDDGFHQSFSAFLQLYICI